MNPLKEAVCLIVSDLDGNVLSVTRPNSDKLALVGGKVDPGETREQAIVRETKEEAGLTIDPSLLQQVYSSIVLGKDGQHFLCTTFVYMARVHVESASEWSVEEGIKVRFVHENVLNRYGAFRGYNNQALNEAGHLFQTVNKGLNSLPVVSMPTPESLYEVRS